jgi:hypothetical protein
MKHDRDFARLAENGPEAGQPSSNSRPAGGGNVIAFPVERTRQHLEAIMDQEGDDAGHCTNGLSTQDYREANAEDRAVYRKWGFAMVFFYGALLLTSGIVAIVVDSNSSLTKLATVSGQRTSGSARSN